MPNTIPPVVSASDVESYRRILKKFAPSFTPIMTFKLVGGISFDSLQELKSAGVKAGKYYPLGVTTNAEDGIDDPKALYPMLEGMEELGLILCIHGEKPGAPVLERERAFLPELITIANRFPRLKIVFEHISTAEAIQTVAGLPATVAATVTAHHLLYTMDDLLGNGLNPHLYCKPLVQRYEDREAIQKVVRQGSPQFFFGSDSAPHPVRSKEGRLSSAGAYSSPVAMPLLISFFDQAHCLEKVENFTSYFGAEFYGIPINKTRQRWVKESWTVPNRIDGVVPLCSGQEIFWRGPLPVTT